MNKTVAKNALAEIFHLECVTENTEHCHDLMKCYFLDGVTIHVDYFLDGTIYINVEEGYGTSFTVGENEDLLFKKCVWFVAENQKVFYNKKNILNWGFNCNLAYVNALYKALNN